MWHETGHRAEVTCIERSPQENIFAVGYADGSVRLWDRSSASVITVFDGHKRAVTCLAFDGHGTRLASGSQDTDIIVWDVVAEAGLYRYWIFSSIAHAVHLYLLAFVDIATRLLASISLRLQKVHRPLLGRRPGFY